MSPRTSGLETCRVTRQASNSSKVAYLVDMSINMTLPNNIALTAKSNDGDKDEDGRIGTGLTTQTRTKTKKPSLYRVLLLNDDYTPMEFVVFILEQLFNKDREQATRIMLHVHQKGVGVCGVFTYEVAETKVAQVRDLAQRHEHPLQCTMEKED